MDVFYDITFAGSAEGILEEHHLMRGHRSIEAALKVLEDAGVIPDASKAFTYTGDDGSFYVYKIWAEYELDTDGTGAVAVIDRREQDAD